MSNVSMPHSRASEQSTAQATPQGLTSAVFGGGCFWCTEAVFKALRGVHAVQSGYCGGHVEHPTYEQVCDKQTGHIEVVKIDFDPAIISYAELLEVFFATHDPTTPGRQGNDVGPQYQSAIFYQNQEQQGIATQYVAQLVSSQQYTNPISTEIRPSDIFWPAEQYHADYFALHPEQGYCQMVIAPKVSKFKKQFLEKLSSK
jgi:peptide-methionine (S)-S-oxide reductase